MSGDTIEFVPGETTCPGSIERYPFELTVSDDSLSVTTGSTILTFTRLPDQAPSPIAATLGCFSNGAFTAHALGPSKSRSSDNKLTTDHADGANEEA